MAGEFGFSLYGNMPVMVHLASRWRLAERATAGASATRELLQQADSIIRMLLQLEEF